MQLRILAIRDEIARNVEQLLRLVLTPGKALHIPAVRRLDALFLAARASRTNVFTGNDAFQRRWCKLLLAAEQAVPGSIEGWMRAYIGEDKIRARADGRMLDEQHITYFAAIHDDDALPVQTYAWYLTEEVGMEPWVPPLEEWLKQLGHTQVVSLAEHGTYVAVALSFAGLEALGIDLFNVFENSPYIGFKRNALGYLTELNFFQQRLLLQALGEKFPFLRSRLGFFNTNSAMPNTMNMDTIQTNPVFLHPTFRVKGFDAATGIQWFWLGDIHLPIKMKYFPDAGVYPLKRLDEREREVQASGMLMGAPKYCALNLGEGPGFFPPEFQSPDCGVVFGAHIL